MKEPQWREQVDHRGARRWTLHKPPSRWFDPALYMINVRQRGRGDSPIYQVHSHRKVVDDRGWKKDVWDHITWTTTLDDAKSVAMLLYASQQTGEVK